MVVEKQDIAALRLAEARGWFPSAGDLAGAELTAAEFGERLRRLSRGGVIRSFKATLVVPPLVGGENWVYAALVASTRRSLGVANALSSRLPFVCEVILNSSLPEGIGPNLAVLFYSRDFESETEFIRSTGGLDYHEVYRVAEYSFPVALPLSTDERRLVRHVVEHPADDAAAVGAALERDQVWVRAKLDRLLWSEANRSGVLRVQPEVNWSLVDNYGHFHFMLETGHRPEQLARLVGEHGFELVFGGKPFQGRYVQVESDRWGVGSLMVAVVLLNQVTGIRVAGVLWNREIAVNDAWVQRLL